MDIPMKKSALVLSLLAVAGIGTAGAVVWSGIYNVAADESNSAPVVSLLQTARQRSIARHASDIRAPDLAKPELIREGAGNYAAMCAGCHLGPGIAPTEISKGLYPAPPVLATTPALPTQQFWVIKHGIKASGRPSWGRSMDDRYIWGMVAFLQALPGMDEATCVGLVASSGGHSHGGGESHPHASEPPANQGPVSQPPPVAPTTHIHADGKAHEHPSADPASKADTSATRTTPTNLAPTARSTAQPHDHGDDHAHQ